MIAATKKPRYGWFYGDVRRRLELPFLTLTEVAYPPGFEVPTHKHDDPWFGFVLEGALIETCCNRTESFQPLTVMFRTAGESHSDRGGELGARSLILDLKRSIFEPISQEFGILKYSSRFCGGALPALALRIYHEFTVTDNVVPLALQGLVFETIAEMHRRSAPRTPKSPDWLKRTGELLRDRFSENINLTALAAEVGVHPVHMARAFRRFYGTSIGDYVRRMRIEWSYNQLLTTATPIVEIALHLGFCDQAHFCRTFKRITGMTPSDVRNSLGGSDGRRPGHPLLFPAD